MLRIVLLLDFKRAHRTFGGNHKWWHPNAPSLENNGISGTLNAIVSNKRHVQYTLNYPKLILIAFQNRCFIAFPGNRHHYTIFVSIIVLYYVFITIKSENLFSDVTELVAFEKQTNIYCWLNLWPPV